MDWNDIKKQQANKKDLEKQKKLDYMRQYAYNYYFTTKAKQRLTNIKMVKPNLYNFVIDTSIRLAKDGHLDSQINDNELKGLLKEINKPKDVNIKRR
jgi:programmed cell death protein 5